MKLRLKEDPREWQKFVAVIAALFTLIAAFLWHKQSIGTTTFGLVIAVMMAGVLAALIRPFWFRGFYRKGMRISNAVGQVMGKVLLTVFFLGFLTPFGLLLRAFGKDLLQLKPPSGNRPPPDGSQPTTDTYWQPANSQKQFDRFF